MKFKRYAILAVTILFALIGLAGLASAHSYYGPDGYRGNNYRPYYSGYYNYGPAVYAGRHYTMGLWSPGYYYNRYYPVNYYYHQPRYYAPNYYYTHSHNYWWGW